MEKTIKKASVAEVKAQMGLLKELLEQRESFLVEALEINKADRHNIKPSDENAAEDYDLLIDEAMDLRSRLANIRIALCNVSNDLLRMY